MTTTQVECVGQYQGCGFRIWELGADCDVPVPATAVAYVGAGMAAATMTAEIEAGDEVTAKSTCGAVYYDVKDIDRIKGWNLTLELIMWDYELLESAIGGVLVRGGSAAPSGWEGKTIGWGAPGPDSTAQPAVTLEIWTRTATNTGTCGAAGANTPQFIRHIFPRTTLQLADRNFESANGAYMKFTGFCGANPVIWNRLANLGSVDDGEGWIADTNAKTDLASATYAQIFSSTLPTLPTDACSLLTYNVA